MNQVLRAACFILSALATNGALSATIWPGFQQDWYIDGAPDSTLVLGQGGTIYVGDTVRDTVVGKSYSVVSVGAFDPDTQTYTDVTFKEYIFSANINDFIDINQPRSWQTVSLAVNTARTPNTSKDVHVKVVADLNSTLLTPARVNLQIRTAVSPDVWTTYDSQGLSGLLTTTPGTSNLLVPANSTYRFTTSGSVTNINVFELLN